MSHKIIVESFNDKAIYSHILINHCQLKADIEFIENTLDWVDLDGLERNKLIIKLKDIKSDILKANATPKIGIIIDLDSFTIQERIKFLNEICSEAFELDVNISKTNEFENFILTDEQLDFNLAYCLVGLNGEGELENILKEIADVTNSHHANCLEQGWKECLTSKGLAVKDKDLRKLWMDFYKRLDCLTPKQRRDASNNVRWDKFLTLHPQKFDFTMNIKELNDIKSFLNQFN